MTADREDFWQAVMARDARFHSAFVYAVRSTGVYCRPTCPSRRPRREQVRFFLLPEQAEQAGFRPCRRCRPRLPAGDQLRKICRLIESNLDGPLTLETLGRQVGMSPHHLQRAFKQALNVSPRQYAGALRIAALKSALKEGHNVTTAMYGAGYGSSRGLYEQAQRRLGMTPASTAAEERAWRSLTRSWTVRSAACWWLPPCAAFVRFTWAIVTNH